MGLDHKHLGAKSTTPDGLNPEGVPNKNIEAQNKAQTQGHHKETLTIIAPTAPTTPPPTTSRPQRHFSTHRHQNSYNEHRTRTPLGLGINIIQLGRWCTEAAVRREWGDSASLPLSATNFTHQWNRQKPEEPGGNEAESMKSRGEGNG